MNLDLFNDLFNSETNTIETDTLSIKEHAISTQDDVIQIDNISMMTKAILRFKISWKEIIFIIIMLILILFPIEFIPNVIPIILLVLYGYVAYRRYEKYLKTRYYIEFNLGSSKNSYLFFEQEEFRNKVYDLIKKSFGDKNQVTFVDIKHQQIGGEQHIFEKGSSNATVLGDDNVIGNNFGSSNNVAIKGDNNVNSNSVKDSTVEESSINTNIEFPWVKLLEQLQTIISNSSELSEQTVKILKKLLIAVEKKDEDEFTVIVKENASFFNQQFIKDLISGTLGGIISSLLLGK
ncbi:hypothetical protein LGW81_08800 [Streptococcus mutans]|uniref:hypothetical protein n=1 Tax=Streptococcus mutans TaxID=1309 RepID=UPI0002B56058|nr:hypothetical protein [Streptococcus mutans]EMB88934.1 hypothetical protein SMU56_00597 [Streptococcus mutans N29]MCB5052439.1 hypothetical protein [Streptococcus mutans]